MSRGSLRVGERRIGKERFVVRRKESGFFGVHLSSGDRIKIARESIIGVESQERDVPSEEEEGKKERKALQHRIESMFFAFTSIFRYLRICTIRTNEKQMVDTRPVCNYRRKEIMVTMT